MDISAFITFKFFSARPFILSFTYIRSRLLILLIWYWAHLINYQSYRTMVGNTSVCSWNLYHSAQWYCSNSVAVFIVIRFIANKAFPKSSLICFIVSSLICFIVSSLIRFIANKALPKSSLIITYYIANCWIWAILQSDWLSTRQILAHICLIEKKMAAEKNGCFVKAKTAC